jgi:hypothetical protein
MRQSECKAVISREQYDAVLLDLDGVILTPPAARGMLETNVRRVPA